MLFCCLKTPLAFPGALKISQSSSPVAAQTPCVSASLTPVHGFVILELLHLDNSKQAALVPTPQQAFWACQGGHRTSLGTSLSFEETN